MAKKTAPPARSSRPGQQKSKEDQWRKRMSAQARTVTPGMLASPGTGSAVADADDETFAEVPVGGSMRVTPRSEGMPATSRPSAASASAAQRRVPTTPPKLNRGRPGVQNTMSIDQEMSYIKGDIRKLVALTVVCILIIVALSFIVPQFVK